MSTGLSMDQVFIDKLNGILETNLENEQFGVRELAQEMAMSRAQLHRKLHALTGKSTSKFIREFRLEKAMKLLKDNVATASEIAYRVGFRSPTYFNTSFHNYYGYPPGEVKYRNPSINKDNRNFQSTKQGHSNQDTATISLIEKISFRQRFILFFSVGLFIIIAFSYYLYFNSTDVVGKETTETIIADNSIAIIPFKNLSDQKEDEYFTRGVMVAIQNHLNKIAGIKVIPDRGMEQYHKTTKSASEIANEINVSYLLDGMVQKYGDSVRVITHLIDTKEDKQLLSMVFDWEYKDIFVIQSNIAKQIAEELNITLSSKELKQIEKIPTTNLEAYNLFLRANFLAFKYTEENMEHAIPIYEKAITLDSTFSEAYANLAYLYLLGGASWGMYSEREAWHKAKQLLLKASQFDPANLDIKSTLTDGLYLYEWDFDRMEREYKRGSKISIIYRIQTGRHEEALTNINKRLQDNPLSSHNYVFKAQALYFLNRQQEAKDLLKSTDKLFEDQIMYLRMASRFYFYMGEYQNSKALLAKIMTDYPDRPPVILWLNAVHAELEDNVEEVNSFLGTLEEKYETHSSGSPAWFIALYYAHIRDFENAFIWLQKSYERHEVEMIWLREEPLLKPLRGDSRYLNLYKKVGFPMSAHKF